MSSDTKDWPYLEDDDGQQQPPAWYEDDREYRLERMQDRVDRLVCAMIASSANFDWAGSEVYMVGKAFKLIDLIDKEVAEDD